MADNVELTGDKIPTALKASEVQLSPVEAAQVASGSGIGQGRFINASRMHTAKPINKLPDGEDPAGWFLIGNKYVNCDGKTPDELEKEDVPYLKNKADAAVAQAAKATSDYERVVLELEAQKLKSQAVEAELTAIKQSQLPPQDSTDETDETNDGMENGGLQQTPSPPAAKMGK